MSRNVGVRLGVFALACLAVTACGSAASPTPSGLPGGAQSDPSITLAMIEPNDGIGPVVDFINKAKTSVDVGTYEIDPTYAPFIDALLGAQSRGVRVRVMVSRTQFPVTGPQENPGDVAALQAKGINAELSNPAFSFYHAKVIVIDGGTDAEQALVNDFNFAAGYFGPETGAGDEGGTRGMSALVTDRADVDEIVAYFNADWPPFAQWPPTARPNLVWSPSATSFTNPGNSQADMLSIINGATSTLDIYAQQFPADSILLQPILDRAKAGVKVRIIANKVGFDSKVAQTLEPAGVQIVFGPKDPYSDGKPLYIHTKTMIVDAGKDRAVAYLGSINPFLAQSLQTERELGALLTDKPSVAKIMTVFNQDFSDPTDKP